jgi:hypothetical protein
MMGTLERLLKRFGAKRHFLTKIGGKADHGPSARGKAE